MICYATYKKNNDITILKKNLYIDKLQFYGEGSYTYEFYRKGY